MPRQPNRTKKTETRSTKSLRARNAYHPFHPRTHTTARVNTQTRRRTARPRTSQHARRKMQNIYTQAQKSNAASWLRSHVIKPCGKNIRTTRLRAQICAIENYHHVCSLKGFKAANTICRIFICATRLSRWLKTFVSSTAECGYGAPTHTQQCPDANTPPPQNYVAINNQGFVRARGPARSITRTYGTWRMETKLNATISSDTRKTRCSTSPRVHAPDCAHSASLLLPAFTFRLGGV